MIPQSNLSGAILSGGQSRRLGRDKALLTLKGQTLLQHAIDLIAPLTQSQVIVSAHERHDMKGVLRIPDSHPGCGPAGGILTALHWTEHPWVLIMSCDTPLISPSTILEITAEIPGQAIDALIPQLNNQLMPLTGIYHKRCLEAFSSAIEAGQYRVQEILQDLRVKVHVLPETKHSEFLNINTLKEYNQILNATRD